MHRSLLAFLFLFSFSTIHAQTVNLRGKVTNQAGKPIAGAVVALLGQDLSDTTGADGSYGMAATGVARFRTATPLTRLITLEKGILTFSLPTASPVMVEIFDVKGTLLRKIASPYTQAGIYRCNVSEKAHADRLLLINAYIGGEGVTFRYLPLHNGRYISNHSVATITTGRGGLAKVTAVDDTVKVSAGNYTEKKIPITSYEQELNITLDTVGGSTGAKPSAGCGKSTSLQKNTDLRQSISAGGKNREYIIRLPADYDPNTPYALWFTPHCMNGTAAGVAAGSAGTGYQYYGMWKFANPAGGKGTTIFCSPEGIGARWADGSDLSFFREMIKKFATDLCIDMSRIFSEGFSMGGSMSYALACALPDTMRAVCMHSGGGMSGCDGTKRGPVPIFITHGTQDPTCTWPGNGWPQFRDLVERDGCTAIDIPGQANPSDNMHPVCFEYQNCDEGYPCRACIFKGDHTPSPGTEGPWGEGNTWVPDSTWSYFKRFY